MTEGLKIKSINPWQPRKLGPQPNLSQGEDRSRTLEPLLAQSTRISNQYKTLIGRLAKCNRRRRPSLHSHECRNLRLQKSSANLRASFLIFTRTGLKIYLRNKL